MKSESSTERSKSFLSLRSGPFLSRILVAIAVGALAFGLRWRAIELLPTDYDETPYLNGARKLADVLRSGELAELTATNTQPEHPQLMQLLFAAAILPAPDSEPSAERPNVGGGMSKLPRRRMAGDKEAGPSGARGPLLACLSPWRGANRDHNSPSSTPGMVCSRPCPAQHPTR